MLPTNIRRNARLAWEHPIDAVQNEFNRAVVGCSYPENSIFPGVIQWGSALRVAGPFWLFSSSPLGWIALQWRLWPALREVRAASSVRPAIRSWRQSPAPC